MTSDRENPMTEIHDTCSVAACGQPARTRGMCAIHYQRWRRTGKTTSARELPPIARAIPKMGWGPKGFDGRRCLLWTAGRDADGYGKFKVDGRTVRAHRWLYEHWIGPIPDGLELDHLCRTPACVNPAHLEPVDARTNTLRGNNPAALNARKTHCKRGHEFDDKNTYAPPSGGRICRRCAADHHARYREEAQIR